MTTISYNYMIITRLLTYKYLLYSKNYKITCWIEVTWGENQSFIYELEI